MIKSDILKNMSNTANTYFIAYTRCMEERKIDATRFQWLPIPALTCLAFSCEVYLKTLILHFDASYPDGHQDYDLKKLFESFTKGHDLEKLFNLIPEDVRDNIKASYINPSQFDKDLNDIKEYFVSSRYLYESESGNFSFSFIIWFHDKLKDMVDNQMQKLAA